MVGSRFTALISSLSRYAWGLIVCEAIPRWRGAGLVRIVLAGAAVAVVLRELADPPPGSDNVLFGGKAAVMIGGGLLALTLLAARQRFGGARRGEVWALLLFPSALLGVLGWAHRWTNDDAFINFRVVDQLLAGNGPVFNAGERVEAYTSALWLALLAGLDAVLRFAALEWIAVVLGLALTVAGLAAATIAARLLHDDRSGLLFPAGALVFAALPPAWDYATSGLETGLSFGWLGGVFLALVAAARNPAWADRRRWRPSRLDLLAVAIGLGPLVRPDFAIFSAAFFALLLAVQRPASVRAVLRPLLLAVALPAAYQVFRMGYFAMLVPNTALAKEAGLSRWDQGAAYAWDTLGTYWLLVPLALLGAWLASRLPDLARRSRTDVLLALLPALAGALHIAYVIKVGGDFMHGRLILPGLFALLMPVAALPLAPHRATATLTAATIAIWAAIAATELRTSYAGTIYCRTGGSPMSPAELQPRQQNPVTLEDHKRHEYARFGAEAKRRAERGEAVMLDLNKGLYEISLPARADPAYRRLRKRDWDGQLRRRTRSARRRPLRARGPDRGTTQARAARPARARKGDGLRLGDRPLQRRRLAHGRHPPRLLGMPPTPHGSQRTSQSGCESPPLRHPRRRHRGGHRANDPVALPRQPRARPESHHRALRRATRRGRTRTMRLDAMRGRATSIGSRAPRV